MFSGSQGRLTVEQGKLDHSMIGSLLASKGRDQLASQEIGHGQDREFFD